MGVPGSMLLGWNQSRLVAPLRRSWSRLPIRHMTLAVGILAMTAFTVPEARHSAGIPLLVCMRCCLAFFGAELVGRLNRASSRQAAAEYFFSPSGLIDLLVLLPVPLALLCGVEPQSAWLFASLWVVKLAQDSPGFAQLGRVFVLQARPLASVLAVFLILLFLASAAMHAIERGGQPLQFGTLPQTLWWAVVTLTTTGYGDEVPKTALGRFLGALVMIGGIATFGLWTGILATGFAAESRRRNFIETWDLVSKVPFFQTLDPSAITEVIHMLRRVEVPEYTAVIRRGRVGDCMYFIASGQVEVSVDRAPVHLGVGEFFGELALLGDSVRTADVTTTEPSTLLILDLADFRTLMAHHPELARVIDNEARRRVNDNQQQRKNVCYNASGSTLSGGNRLAHYGGRKT